LESKILAAILVYDFSSKMPFGAGAKSTHERKSLSCVYEKEGQAFRQYLWSLFDT